MKQSPPWNAVVIPLALALAAGIFSLPAAAAESVSEKWVARFNGAAPGGGNDIARAVAVDAAGNVAVTGQTAVSGTDIDIYTAKYAGGDGQLLWQKTYGFSVDGTDSAIAVAIDPAGNVIVTGSSVGTTPDYYTAKYAAADGALLWEQRFDGGGTDFARGMVLDGAGNVIVTGYEGSGNGDFHTIKYAAADGAILWEASYDSPAHDTDLPAALAVDGAGNVAVTGYFTGPGGVQGNYTAVYAGTDGHVIWEKYSAPGVTASAVAVTASGNVAVTGWSANAAGNDDLYTVLYAAADGNTLWEVVRDGADHEYDHAHGVATDAAGNVAVTGYFGTPANADAYTAKYAAADGHLLWEKIDEAASAGRSVGVSISVDSGGNVFIAGEISALSEGGGFNDDYYTAKYAAADGQLLWEKSFGSVEGKDDRLTEDQPFQGRLALTPDGGAVVTGASTNAAGNFDFATVKYAPPSTPGPEFTDLDFPFEGGQLHVSGGTGPYTFTVVSGNLPDGLLLASDGTVTGAATSNAPVTFEIRVQDSAQPPHVTTRTFTFPPPAALPTDVVSWFSGDWAAHDLVGGNHGAPRNGATFNHGMVSSAFQLDGADDFVEVLPTSALDLAGDLTIEAWVNPTVVSGDRAIVSTTSADYNKQPYLLLVRSGELGFAKRSADNVSLFRAGTIPTNQWSHVAATISGSDVTLYVNGAAVGSQSLPVRVASGGPVIIGGVRAQGLLSAPYAGLIDELTIYSRPLSAAEIGAIATAGAAGKRTSELARGFSPTVNPSGPWTYGRLSAATAPNVATFTTLSTPATDGPLQLWRGGATFPQFGRNPSPSAYAPWGPGQMALHPSASGEFAAVRWTAERTGTYAIASSFTLMTGSGTDGTDVHLRLTRKGNGTPTTESIYDGLVTTGAPTVSYGDTRYLFAGDSLYFIAGKNGTATSDSTGLAVSITPVPAREFFRDTGLTITTKRPPATGRSWQFKTIQPSDADGLALKVQSSPDGVTYADLPGGGAMARVSGSSTWLLTTTEIPTGTRHFRLCTSALGLADFFSLAAENPLIVGTLPLAIPADKLRVTLIRGNKGAQTIPESGVFEFLATQAGNSSDPTLQVDVQSTATPDNAASWQHFTSLRRKAGAKTWTDEDSPRVPGAIYFRTVTYSDDLAAAFMAVPVGPITVTPSHDLTLTITPVTESLPNQTHPGELITYRLKYENNGSVAATNVSVAAKLPKNTSYAAEQGGGHSGDLVTLLAGKEIGGVYFPVGALAVGAKGERYFTVKVNPLILDKVDTATIEYATYDSVLTTAPMAMGRSAKVLAAIFTDKPDAPGKTIGYPASGVSTAVFRPLQIELTQDRDSARPGELVTYTFTLTNHGAVALSDVKLTQILPDFTELETFASFSGGSFNGQARAPDEYQNTPADATRPSYRRAGPFRVLDWLFPSVPAHGSRVAIFTVRLQADTPLVVPGIFGSLAFPTRIANNNSRFSASYLSGTKTLLGDGHGEAPPEITLIPEYPVDAPQIQFEREAVGLGDGRGHAFYQGRTVATVLPGDFVEYRLHYRNLGGAVAKHCVISETIAEDATFYGSLKINDQTPNPVNYTFFNAKNLALPQADASDPEKLKLTRGIAFSIGHLAPGQSGVITYRVRAAGLPPKETVAKPGDVLTSQSFNMRSDSLAKPETGTPSVVPVLVVRPAVYTIQTTEPDRTEPYKAGDLVEFTARYRNEGGALSPETMIAAEIPEGVDFASANIYDASGAEITVPVKISGSYVNFKVGKLTPYNGGDPNDPANGGSIKMRVRLQDPLPAKLLKPPFRVKLRMAIDKDPTPAAANGLRLLSLGGDPSFNPTAGLTGTLINVAESKPGILWAGKIMPKFLHRASALTIRIFYGNCGDVAIPNVRVAIQIPFGTILNTTASSPGLILGDKTKGYTLKTDIARWSIGDLAPHSSGIRDLVVFLKKDAAYRDDTFTEYSAYVGSIGTDAVPATVPDAIPGPVSTIVYTGDPRVSAGKAFGKQLGTSGGSLRGASTPEGRVAIASLTNLYTTTVSGADAFTLPNGAFIVQNGGNNVVAGGGGNVVAGGGGNVVAGGGGNVVAAGAGNFITVNGVGLCSTANLKSFAARVVAGGGGNIVAAGAGNIVNNLGLNLIANDGATLIGNDGAGITGPGGAPLQIKFANSGVIAAGAGNLVSFGVGQLLPTGISELIGQDGGGALSLDGSQLVSGKGSTLIANDGGTFISRPPAGLIGQDGAGVIGQDGGGLIGNDGAGLIGNDGAGLIGNDGGGLIGNDGGSLIFKGGIGIIDPKAGK